MSFYGPLEVQEFVHEVFLEKCIQVAITSVLAYDTLITMDKEIKYFWTQRWYSLTHVLYFINRYVGIFGITSKIFRLSLEATNSLCLFGQWGGTIGDTAIGVIIDYILIIRVLALWNNSRLMTIILNMLIVGELCAKFALIVLQNLSYDVHAFALAEGMSFCGSYSNQIARAAKYIFLDWIINAIIGLVLLVLALIKAVEHWRLTGLRGFSIVNIMIKDQIIWYVLVLFCSAMNMAVAQMRPSLSSVKFYIFNVLGSTSFLCLLGSRMFLNLKEAGEPQVNEMLSLPNLVNTTHTISAPQFATPAGRPADLGVSSSTISEIAFGESRYFGSPL